MLHLLTKSSDIQQNLQYQSIELYQYNSCIFIIIIDSMEQSFQDQQLSIGSFSDDEPIPEENQTIEEAEPSSEGFSQSGGGQIELIYSMFTLYRKELNQLAEKYQCKMRFSISTYVVEQPSGQSKDKFFECLREAQKFMKSINMLEISWLTTEAQKRRFFNSPYICQLLEKKNIRLVYFQNKVFAVSRQLHFQLLKKELVKITKQIIIFSIRIRRINRRVEYLNNIYNHVAEFFKLILVYYQKFFKERDVVVRLTKSGEFLMLHGTRAKYIMESKFTLKNAIESMVCLFVKDAPIDRKHLKKYLSKAALFPVYSNGFNNSTTIIISKDNVLRQLIQKSPNFLKYLGIQASNQQEQLKYEPQVGFYLVPTESFGTKMDNIRQKYLNRCYDTHALNGIRFLKRTFSKTGQQATNLHRELLIDMISCVQQYKLKYQVIKDFAKVQPKKIEQKEDDNLKYQIMPGGKQSQPELSKLLRRDVLYQKVRMKKKHIIAYNILQTPQEPAYWIVNKNGQEQDQVKVEELKKGIYLKGLKKVDGNGEVVKLFEQLLTIL